MFLSYFCGHQGPSASFPCIFCLLPLKDLSLTGDVKKLFVAKTYSQRDFSNMGNSVKYPMLFPIEITNIVPPVLHISLGLFSDFFKKLHDQVKQIDLIKTLNLGEIDIAQQKTCKALFGKNKL